MRGLPTTVFIVCQVLVPGVMAQGSGDSARYVTRFDQRQRLTYTPRFGTVEKMVSVPSWLPMGRKKIERRQVPVVSWTPRWRNEVQPITERIAPETVAPRERAALPKTDANVLQQNVWQSGPAPQRVNTRSSGTFANAQKKTHQPPRPKERTTGGVIAIGRVSPTRIPIRPIGVVNPDEFGGVQQFSVDRPRIGLRSPAY